jgi:hypothetical protein
MRNVKVISLDVRPRFCHGCKRTGTRCTVCHHPDRQFIEAGRCAGVSLDVLSEKYSVHRKAIWRHMRQHVSADERALYLADLPMEELAHKAAEASISLLDYLALTRKIVMGALVTAGAVETRPLSLSWHHVPPNCCGSRVS